MTSIPTGGTGCLLRASVGLSNTACPLFGRLTSIASTLRGVLHTHTRHLHDRFYSLQGRDDHHFRHRALTRGHSMQLKAGPFGQGARRIRGLVPPRAQPLNLAAKEAHEEALAVVSLGARNERRGLLAAVTCR